MASIFRNVSVLRARRMLEPKNNTSSTTFWIRSFFVDFISSYFPGYFGGTILSVSKFTLWRYYTLRSGINTLRSRGGTILSFSANLFCGGTTLSFGKAVDVLSGELWTLLFFIQPSSKIIVLLCCKVPLIAVVKFYHIAVPSYTLASSTYITYTKNSKR